MTYLLDADTQNYLLKRLSPITERYGEAVRTGSDFALSGIVHDQITRYLKLKGATRLQQVYSGLTSGCVVVDLCGEDWDRTADLWSQRHRNGKPIEDADLLIAVAALKAGAVLVTNNVRHFEGPGVEVENWMSP